MPTATSSGSAARIAATRRRTSSGRNAPAESTMKTPWLPASATTRGRLGQPAGVEQVRGVQVAVGGHAELAGEAEVLDADVGLGADGRDAGDRRAGVARGLEVAPWCRSPGRIATAISRALDHARPPPRAARRRSAAAGRTGSSSRRARRRGRRRSPRRRRGRAPRATVAHLVDAVTGGAIACEPSRSVVSTIRTRPPRSSRRPPACSSATRTAAEVMMSRLPAYGGQVVAGALDLEHHRRPTPSAISGGASGGSRARTSATSATAASIARLDRVRDRRRRSRRRSCCAS